MKFSRYQNRLISLLLMVVFLGCNHASCERDTRVVISEAANPPTFSLSGNGHLNFFWVSELDNVSPTGKESRAVDDERTIWEIWPTNVRSTAIYDLPPIVYGRVPAGFTQKIPAVGGPRPLVEGKSYEAGGPSSGANMKVFRFSIKDGKAIER